MFVHGPRADVQNKGNPLARTQLGPVDHQLKHLPLADGQFAQGALHRGLVVQPLLVHTIKVQRLFDPVLQDLGAVRLFQKINRPPPWWL